MRPLAAVWLYIGDSRVAGCSPLYDGDGGTPKPGEMVATPARKQPRTPIRKRASATSRPATRRKQAARG
jgi:hypothetical protein